MNTKPSHLFILINIAWIFIIFILCAVPGENLPAPHWKVPQLDKFVHFGMYFILSLLLIYPLERYTRLKLSAIYTIAILVSLIYGGLIEILQDQYFNRSGDIWDLVADVLGALGGCLCYPLTKRLFHIR